MFSRTPKASKDKDSQSKKVQKVLAKIQRNEGNQDKKSSVFASPASKRQLRSSSNTSTSEDVQLEDAKVYVDPSGIRELYFMNDIESMRSDEIRVKLIISALGLNSPSSPIRDRFGKITGIAKLGTVHTALQLGPVIAEWNVSEIVNLTPSNQYGNFKALAVIDIKTFDVETFVTKHLDPICKTITQWNAAHSYKETTTNCQKFTQQLLSVMGIKDPLVSGSKIKQFVDAVSELDKKDIEFTFTFAGDKQPTVFQSHEQLDMKCFERFGSPREVDPQDLVLLKAYDRVYWLRYYDALADEIMSPEKKEVLISKFRCGNSCFFHDPSTTPTTYADVSALDDGDCIHPM